MNFDKLQYAEKQDLPPVHGEEDFNVTNRGEIQNKKSINFIFEQNPELSKVGSREQYLAYLETIFPESKVRRIVFHGNKKDITTIKSLRDISLETQVEVKHRGGSLSKTQKRLDYVGMYFTKSLSTAKIYSKSHPKDIRRVYPALLNIKNPGVTTTLGSIGLNLRKAFINKKLIDPRYITEDEYNDLIVPRGIDGWIHEDYDYTVFDSNQIHMLGSKEDLESFRDFVSKERKE